MSMRLALLAALLWARSAAGQGVDGAYRGYVEAGPSSTERFQSRFRSNFLGGEFEFVLWPGRGLAEDGKPLAIQTFQQRPNEVGLSAHADAFQRFVDQNPSSHGEELEATVFGGHWFSNVFLGAGLHAERVDEAPATAGAFSPFQYTLLEPDVELAVQLGSVRLAADYQWRRFWKGDLPKNADWGRIALSVRALLADTMLFTVRGYNLHGSGEGATLQVNLYPRARLGLYWSAYYEDGTIYFDSLQSYTRLGLTLGFGLRLTRQLELDPFFNVDVATQDLPDAAPVGTVVLAVAIPIHTLRAGVSVLWRFQ